MVRRRVTVVERLNKHQEVAWMDSTLFLKHIAFELFLSNMQARQQYGCKNHAHIGYWFCTYRCILDTMNHVIAAKFNCTR